MELLHAELKGQNPHDAGISLLERLCGAPLPEIRRTKLGKPYFIDDPRHFSITHTPKHIFVALSDKPIGIDAEELDRHITPALAEKILSPGEFAQYRLAEDQRRALLTFWVLKEAEGKLTGEGLRIYPNHTDFSLTDPRVQELHGCLVAVIERK